MTRFSETQTAFPIPVCYGTIRLSPVIVRRVVQDAYRDMMSPPSCKGPGLLYENSIQLRFVGRDIDVVAVIEQVYMIQTVQKTIENPQLQCIDESINDSGVRAPQVLIVEKTVEGSQLQWVIVRGISTSPFQLTCSSS